MFKLAHLSDIHAGYKAGTKINAQGINLREADGYVALSKMVSDIIEEEVHAVVIAGDIFHTPTPDVRTVIFVQNQLRRFWQAGIKVYMLTGNHDTNDIASDISASKILNDPWRHIYSHAEPYVSYEISTGIYLHMISHHTFSTQKETMKMIKPVEGAINILSTHGSMYDPFFHSTLHSEGSPREIVIPDYLVKDYKWDYALFGHIHERGWLGSEDGETDTMGGKVYYNGSLIRRGFSDKKVPLGRGWTLWNIQSDGLFIPEHKLIPQRPQYDLPVIDALEMTASEISEQIIKNLKNTQANGTTYNNAIAPILRQTVINMTTAKNTALDHKSINANSAHAMHMKLNIKQKPIGDVDSVENGEQAANLDNVDVVKGYDDWVKKSETLKDYDDVTKEQVIEEARNYVKLGQEGVLDEDS